MFGPRHSVQYENENAGHRQSTYKVLAASRRKLGNLSSMYVSADLSNFNVTFRYFILDRIVSEGKETNIILVG